MESQFLYLNDALTMAFETEVTEELHLPDGRLGVILTQTFFYPTGGGQEHDTGSLGIARVVDVFKRDDGEAVIHIVDQYPGTGVLKAQIDAERRLRHMQHHTAQHLLSSCFQHIYNLETLSSGIHGYDPATIDLPDTELSRACLDRIETTANQIVYENRGVKSYFVNSEKIDTVPLRRPPKVEDQIRIVEIDNFDYSACGATHCPQTGMIGVIKIIRTERINQKLRIHFVAGIQAMEYFRQFQEIATDLASDLSAHPRDVVDLVRKQFGQLQTAEKELRKLRLAYGAFEAQALITNAETVGNFKLIAQTYENRSVDEIRSLSNEFKNQVRMVTFLATFDGQKVVLVTTCGPDTGLSARELLNRQLAMINGRGGGDDQIAQGGGTATPEQFETFLSHVKTLL